MIVPTMTLPELVTEIQSDYKEVIARWKVFEPKFMKMRQKRTIYPWVWETTLITKRKNEWHITFYAYSKKDASAKMPQIFMPFRYENATWAAFFMRGQDTLFLFSSHFFDRYIERYLEFEKTDMTLSTKDIVRFFFLRNYQISCSKHQYEDSLRGFCEDGIFLGDWLSDTATLVKTYLSRKELKPNQYAEFYDAVVFWIIHDMVLSRKGHTLTSEEIDELPDTYFSPEEWNSFLYNRGNPEWISLAKECVNFRSEHPEEYDKCSRMIDTIKENQINNL